MGSQSRGKSLIGSLAVMSQEDTAMQTQRFEKTYCE